MWIGRWPFSFLEASQARVFINHRGGETLLHMWIFFFLEVSQERLFFLEASQQQHFVNHVDVCFIGSLTGTSLLHYSFRKSRRGAILQNILKLFFLGDSQGRHFVKDIALSVYTSLSGRSLVRNDAIHLLQAYQRRNNKT